MYDNDTANGSFYLAKIMYGGNGKLKMAHQRQVSLTYESRSDKRTTYLGGHKICIDKRLATIESHVHDKLIHKHILAYDTNTVTQASRLKTLTLSDALGATLRPLRFDWSNGPEKAFEPVPGVVNIKTGSSSFEILPMDVTASGKTDMVIVSSRYDPGKAMENALHLAIHLADGQGKVNEAPSPGSGFPGLRFPDQLLPLDITGDGKTDLVSPALSCTSFAVFILVVSFILPKLRKNITISPYLYQLGRTDNTKHKIPSNSHLSLPRVGSILEILP
jgi:hypothetical protein